MVWFAHEPLALPLIDLLAMDQLIIPGTTVNLLTKDEQFHRINVSPDIAVWLLGRSAGNTARAGRTGVSAVAPHVVVRPDHLRLIKGIIARGEWKATHQGAALDWNGVLFDGHHRLVAIAEQDQTLPMYFKVGCDPVENLAVDQGAVRTTADTLQMDKREAELLRLAFVILGGFKKPTPAQIDELAKRLPLIKPHRQLVETCSVTRRVFTTAPMRLAACLRIIASKSPDYVLRQWKALALADYDAMSKSAKALARQVMDGSVSSNNTYDLLARGLVVFDEERADVSRIQIKDSIEAARFAKGVLLPWLDF